MSLIQEPIPELDQNEDNKIFYKIIIKNWNIIIKNKFFVILYIFI